MVIGVFLIKLLVRTRIWRVEEVELPLFRLLLLPLLTLLLVFPATPLLPLLVSVKLKRRRMMLLDR